jgi:polar amino acid transport system substrate-binding protein
MNHWLRAVLLASTLLLTGGAGAAPLRMLTTDVAPLAFLKDGKPAGFCIDLATEIERRLGEVGPIELLPWARAFHVASTARGAVLVCPKRTAEREHMFQWVGPVLNASTRLYAKAAAPHPPRTLAEARKLPSVLVIRESYAHHDLMADGFQNLTLVNDATAMLQMLLADRAPAMVLETVQFDVVTRAAPMSLPSIVPLMKLRSSPTYFAFSVDVPAAVVGRWQATLAAMKKDGSFARIYATWFAAPALPARKQP